jgi:hypothetical protein
VTKRADGYFDDYERQYQARAVAARDVLLQDPAMQAKFDEIASREWSVRINNARVVDAMREMKPLRDALVEAEHNHKKAIADYFGVEHWPSIELSTWRCDASPTKHCVYDMSSPMGEDDCLVCHQPSERK